MKVITAFPPNYRRINAAFNVRGRGVIFCYGDVIYNPGRINVTPALLAHEAVHSGQQGADPATWWDRYIADPQFRLAQEIPAHAAEYRVAPHLLQEIAGRLSSRLYGGLIARDAAEHLLVSA